MKLKNYWLHFKTIIKHKWYVFLACKDCGIIWRGIKHDLSKFSPTEFFEYAENYTAGRSPVDIAKEKYGYCKAWLHHRGEIPIIGNIGLIICIKVENLLRCLILTWLKCYVIG